MSIKIGGIDNPTAIKFVDNGITTNLTEVWYKSSPTATAVKVWPDTTWSYLTVQTRDANKGTTNPSYNAKKVYVSTSGDPKFEQATATPKTGYRFKQWNYSNSGSLPTKYSTDPTIWLKVVPQKNNDYYAEFERDADPGFKIFGAKGLSGRIYSWLDYPSTRRYDSYVTYDGINTIKPIAGYPGMYSASGTVDQGTIWVDNDTVFDLFDPYYANSSIFEVVLHADDPRATGSGQCLLAIVKNGVIVKADVTSIGYAKTVQYEYTVGPEFVHMFMEGSVNGSAGTMTYNGQTYQTWVRCDIVD